MTHRQCDEMTASSRSQNQSCQSHHLSIDSHERPAESIVTPRIVVILEMFQADAVCSSGNKEVHVTVPSAHPTRASTTYCNTRENAPTVRLLEEQQ
jgi:hypothetical protein